MTTHAVLVSAATELPTQWLLARASGLLAYVLLTLAVIAGLTLRSRLLGRTVPPAIVTAVHQTLSLVGLLAVAIHASLIVLDTKVDVPLLALVVPGLSDYRTFATSLGVVALELWLVIHFSFRLRRRVGMKRWRMLHMATFPTWALAAAHGVLAGTDTSLPWAQDLYAGSIGFVAFLLVLRVGSRNSSRPARPAPVAATATTTARTAPST
jgi:predicted ferric reductase